MKNIKGIIEGSTKVLVVILCIIFISSCSNNLYGLTENQRNDTLNDDSSSKLNSMVYDNGCVYYFAYSGEQEVAANGIRAQQILYQYNVNTHQKIELDKGIYFGGIAKIDNKIYYTLYNEISVCNVISRDLTDLTESKLEAQISDITYSAGIARPEKEYIYEINNEIYVNIDNIKLYLIKNGNIIEKPEIVSAFSSGQYVFYSDKTGGIFRYDTQTFENENIISADNIKNNISSALGPNIRTHNIVVDNGEMFFVVSPDMLSYGIVMHMNLNDKNTLKILRQDEKKVMVSNYISVYNGRVYFINDENILCASEKSYTEIIEKQVYDFDIINDTLYCFVMDNGKTVVYSKRLDEENSEFQML